MCLRVNTGPSITRINLTMINNQKLGAKAPSLEKEKMKTNYDQLAAVLKLWYSDEQIQEIWKLLKDYDDQLMEQTKITKDK